METTAKRKRLYLSLSLAVALVLLVALLFLLAPRTIGPRYTIRRLVAPGFVSTQPQSINDLGEVIGWANNLNGGEGFFIWDRDGKATEIVLDVEGKPWFSKINNKGQALGEISSGTRTLYPFIWSASEGLRKPSFGANETARALDMNDRGELAGITWSASKIPHATLWNSNLEATLLTDATSSWAWQINNRGTAFCSAYDRSRFLARGSESIYLKRSEMRFSVEDMNDAELFVGTSYKGNPAGRIVSSSACVWSATRGMEFLEQLNGFETEGAAINNKGQVVGWTQPAQASPPPRWVETMLDAVSNLNLTGHDLEDLFRGGRESTAFFWEDGKMTPLIDLVEDPSEWISLVRAKDINEAGEIVGYGIHREVTTGFMAGFVLTPIKESDED